MVKFAANLSMMFTEVDFLDRFEAAAKAGFKGVEFLFPYEWPADEIAARLKANKLTQALFNLPPGDWTKGERVIIAPSVSDEDAKSRFGGFDAPKPYLRYTDAPKG